MCGDGEGTAAVDHTGQTDKDQPTLRRTHHMEVENPRFAKESSLQKDPRRSFDAVFHSRSLNPASSVFLHLQRMLPFQTNFLDLLTCSFEPQKGPVQHASAQGELVSIAA